ncbi:hypothetical protein Y029_443 [Burkholderia pseudomallei MSHR303]|nr:hypothetical protein BDL_2118 [Burkholderia pseudomallei MSHR305]AHK65681.1 hypothetical protein BBX_510 [Burkholderia pseudomallei MSHR520]AIP78231.1 hypothetical protein JE55_1511 [Burkholderia pseudomallei]KGV64462.1 hypothetical protein X900_5822 [Burkholderia pseudomallei BDU 2]KGW53813.1 hypothetical protein Y029_443 [Burkholderia pseudomallei MSHR303]
MDANFNRLPRFRQPSRIYVADVQKATVCVTRFVSTSVDFDKD